MSNMPPDHPTEPSATPPPPPTPPPEPPMGATVVGATITEGPPRTQISVTDIARLPMPGNAEFALWAFLEIVFTLLWWIDDDVDVTQWMTITTALTFAYFISRGIAKASRVLEQ